MAVMPGRGRFAAFVAGGFSLRVESDIRRGPFLWRRGIPGGIEHLDELDLAVGFRGDLLDRQDGDLLVGYRAQDRVPDVGRHAGTGVMGPHHPHPEGPRPVLDQPHAAPPRTAGAPGRGGPGRTRPTWGKLCTGKVMKSP